MSWLQLIREKFAIIGNAIGMYFQSRRSNFVGCHISLSVGHYIAFSYFSDYQEGFVQFYAQNKTFIIRNKVQRPTMLPHEFLGLILLQRCEILNFMHFLQKRDIRTDRPTDRPTDGRTHPLIYMRGRIKKLVRTFWRERQAREKGREGRRGQDNGRMASSSYTET